MELVVDSLRKHFGTVRAVDGVSFACRAGEVHGFIGPNGAGKTTTLRILATVEECDAGRVELGGKALAACAEALRPTIGFMPDFLESYRDMLVEEYLDFYARLYRLAPSRRRSRIEDVAAFTGIQDLRNRSVAVLSKGQKQRLGLARVLVHDPDVLLLDEPAAGLDPRARVEVRSLLRLLADRGKIVLVSSHILAELAEICDAVTILDQGQVRASGALSELQGALGRACRLRIALAAEGEAVGALRRTLAELPSVAGVEPVSRGAVISFVGDLAAQAALVQGLVSSGFAVAEVERRQTDLEHAFLHLTGVSS